MSETPLSCVLLGPPPRSHGRRARLLETVFARWSWSPTRLRCSRERSASARGGGRGRFAGPGQRPGLVARGPAALSRPQDHRPQRPRRGERPQRGAGSWRRRLRAQARDRHRPAAGHRGRPLEPQQSRYRPGPEHDRARRAGFGEVFYANSNFERRSSRSHLSSRPQATSIEAAGPVQGEPAATAGLV